MKDWVKIPCSCLFQLHWHNMESVWILTHSAILFANSYPEGFGVDAKPRLASYRQIFLAPSEEEKCRRDDLPAPDEGNAWHMGSIILREAKQSLVQKKSFQDRIDRFLDLQRVFCVAAISKSSKTFNLTAREWRWEQGFSDLFFWCWLCWQIISLLMP